MKRFPEIAVLAAAMLLTVSLPAAAQSHGGHGGASSFHGGGHGAWGGGGWHGGGGWRGGYGGYGGYYRGGYWGPGPFWGGLGLGLGFGAVVYDSAYGYGYGYDGYYPAPVYAAPPTDVVAPNDVSVDPPVQTGVRPAGRAVPLVSKAPDPIFYPKNGQTAAKTEGDRVECNRWATTQAGAMNDASIFQRATFACMEGRGYVVK